MDKNIILSLVVVTNNEMKMEKMLGNSLNNQSFKEYELIIIDGRLYTSASAAYNAGGVKAKGYYILFLHHDIVFTSENSIKKIMEFSDLLNSEQFSLLGFAGAVNAEWKRTAGIFL